MTTSKTSRARMLAAFGALLAGALPARAADTTYERLVNPEPQNWLMNHRDYTAQRYSALDAINRTNAKNLKLLFAVALGGTSNNESLEATPLVEDGYMYMVDSSNHLAPMARYKFVIPVALPADRARFPVRP
jgi:glucose dehydrogenase